VIGPLRRHLSFANVASALALAVALTTSGAYAASQLAPKSVGERQLRPGAVTAEKLRKNAVTAAKIQAGAVGEGKIGQGAVTEAKLANAAVSAPRLANNSVITEKLASEAVTGEKVNESTLAQVPSASKAATAAFAESANPAAFANVGKDGSLDSEGSKGIASTEKFEAGVYCIAATFTPKGAQVTPEFDAIAPLAAFARIGGAGNPCPYPELEVQIRNAEGKKTEAPFFALLYR
jgi:hypothetical protein